MHTLPDLKYDLNALEPAISADTMRLHHGKHHQAYVDNLNNLIKGCKNTETLSLLELASGSEQIKCSNRQGIINNAGGHYNHSLFWSIMNSASAAGGNPKGRTLKMINDKYGNFQNFVDEFSQTALSRFGSGWVFLQSDGQIISTANQDTPMLMGLAEPVLGLDVWEHAYYLDYQNRRGDYIKSWWNVVDWQAVEARLLSTTTK